jgi:hypothetical protein
MPKITGPLSQNIPIKHQPISWPNYLNPNNSTRPTHTPFLYHEKWHRRQRRSQRRRKAEKKPKAGKKLPKEDSVAGDKKKKRTKKSVETYKIDIFKVLNPRLLLGRSRLL